MNVNGGSDIAIGCLLQNFSKLSKVRSYIRIKANRSASTVKYGRLHIVLIRPGGWQMTYVQLVHVSVLVQCLY